MYNGGSGNAKFRYAMVEFHLWASLMRCAGELNNIKRQSAVGLGYVEAQVIRFIEMRRQRLYTRVYSASTNTHDKQDDVPLCKRLIQKRA